MSTKNLARTVIEGGRYYHNCWERRHSHAEARAAERDALAAVRGGADADDLAWPRRKKVHRTFRDKLSAVERWLRSNVGRPWDLVRAEIFARFDVRTLAGQHVVFDHLLPSRWSLDGTWHVSRDLRFRVDRHGILRADARPWARPRRDDVDPTAQRRALALADGRRVVRRGTRWYWLVPVEPFEPGGARRYRQDRALDARETAELATLPEPARAAIERVLP